MKKISVQTLLVLSHLAAVQTQMLMAYKIVKINVRMYPASQSLQDVQTVIRIVYKTVKINAHLSQEQKKAKDVPDSDGDGVYDHLDVCPANPGTVANKGCPEIQEEVKEQIRLAAKGIFFESGKEVIKAESLLI